MYKNSLVYSGDTFTTSQYKLKFLEISLLQRIVFLYIFASISENLKDQVLISQQDCSIMHFRFGNFSSS